MSDLSRGAIYRYTGRGKGYEQRGSRMAVVVQSDWYALSSVIVAPTSTSALAASFRPEVTIGDHRTRVLCEQVVAIDVRRLQDFVGWLEDEHLAEVDAALTLILGLD